MNNTEAAPLETAPHRVLLEFTLDEGTQDMRAIVDGVLKIMYPHRIGELPGGIQDVRWLALDDVYRPCATEVELRR